MLWNNYEATDCSCYAMQLLNFDFNALSKTTFYASVNLLEPCSLTATLLLWFLEILTALHFVLFFGKIFQRLITTAAFNAFTFKKHIKYILHLSLERTVICCSESTKHLYYTQYIDRFTVWFFSLVLYCCGIVFSSNWIDFEYDGDLLFFTGICL